MNSDYIYSISFHDQKNYFEVAVGALKLFQTLHG